MPKLVLGSRQIATLLTALDWYVDDRLECAKLTSDQYDANCNRRAADEAQRLWHKVLAVKPERASQ